MSSEQDNSGPIWYDDYDVLLGELMRGERATLGYSLLDVERDLRIKASHIAAIEDGNLEAFKTVGIVPGYVRSYAKFLNFDPDKTFERFCHETGFVRNGSMTKKPSGRLHESTVSNPAGQKSTAFSSLDKPVPFAPAGGSVFGDISAGALSSVLVMALIVGSIGFGGWKLLEEIQRVEFAPVEQSIQIAETPIEMPSIDVASETSASGEFDLAASQESLSELYRVQELSVPELVPRDGPIASIDPATLSSFGDTDVQVAVASEPEQTQPKVVADGPPSVDVVVTQPAWVRVYLDDGSVLFEKILEAGERYRLPADVQQAKLRAGNAGAVYVMVGDQTFGPVGPAGGVARDVALEAQSVEDGLVIAESLFDEPLAPPINLVAGISQTQP